MGHALYALDKAGVRVDEDDVTCCVHFGRDTMKTLCEDMAALGMVQGDDSALGIPVGKLHSHEGWIVTSDGVSQALAAYRAAPRETVDEVRGHWEEEDGNRFDRWVEFLGRAEQGAGFQAW